MATVLDLATLADDCYKDASTGVGQWVRIHDTPPLGGITGFFGAAYSGGAGGKELVLAFRGSEGPGDDFVRDWLVNNAAIIFPCFPIAQVAEAEIFARTLAGIHSKAACYITGHSLGGALAQVVAGNLSGTIGLTFNAPGVKNHHWARTRSWCNEQSVWNIRADGDPVSAPGCHVGHRPITIGLSGISTLMTEGLRIYQAVTGGLFVGLGTGVPQLALVSGAATGVVALRDVATKAVAAHKMTAILAGLKDSAIANSRPESLQS